MTILPTNFPCIAIASSPLVMIVGRVHSKLNGTKEPLIMSHMTARSRCRAPRRRSPSYDLRCTPCDHRDWVSNAVHGGHNQRLPSCIAYNCGLFNPKETA